MLSNVREQWFSNVRADVLAGLVVGLALIPEAIAFSIIAGVDPKVGLYASFCIAVVISFVGGRPAMISAATGAMALVMTTLVKEHGLQYLLQQHFNWCHSNFSRLFKLAKLMRFVSKSVVIGFVNACHLIFMAQLPELINVTWHVYAISCFGLGLFIYSLIPKIGKLFLSFICIVIVTLLARFLGIDVRTVGDMGSLPDTLPIFLIPNIPLNLETLLIIFLIHCTGSRWLT
jgi:SulP family sulfate permease